MDTILGSVYQNDGFVFVKPKANGSRTLKWLAFISKIPYLVSYWRICLTRFPIGGFSSPGSYWRICLNWFPIGGFSSPGSYWRICLNWFPIEGFAIPGFLFVDLPPDPSLFPSSFLPELGLKCCSTLPNNIKLTSTVQEINLADPDPLLFTRYLTNRK
jgi:hypothetical protein